MRDWAFGPRGQTNLVSYIDPKNTASIRVAERLGGVIDPDAATPWEDPDLVYRYHPGGRT
jgi:RimJ/RimL family protein N-acetyltransferase